MLISWVGCVVLLTGPTDYASDGVYVVALSNGHPLMGEITGSGCIVGSCVASFCAAAMTESSSIVNPTTLIGAVSGYDSRNTILLTIAAQVAAESSGVHGRGTFLPALIDELSVLAEETIRKTANVRVYGPDDAVTY